MTNYQIYNFLNDLNIKESSDQKMVLEDLGLIVFNRVMEQAKKELKIDANEDIDWNEIEKRYKQLNKEKELLKMVILNTDFVLKDYLLFQLNNVSSDKKIYLNNKYPGLSYLSLNESEGDYAGAT